MLQRSHVIKERSQSFVKSGRRRWRRNRAVLSGASNADNEEDEEETINRRNQSHG